jgi:predicted site-specific integrase-resolvase
MTYLTGNQAARLLGISRRTLYRWADEGRLYQWQWTEAQIEARRAQLAKRPRGPRRNPESARYVTGRHSFTRGIARSDSRSENP